MKLRRRLLRSDRALTQDEVDPLLGVGRSSDA